MVEKGLQKIVLPIRKAAFNPVCKLPYGLNVDHIYSGMQDYIAFLDIVNPPLLTRGLPRLEEIMMPASFSSLVSDLMVAGISKASPTLKKNLYHNGHPDLVPARMFPNDAVQHAKDGIELKASRYLKGWQGHNPENIFLMVFVYQSNRPVDMTQGSLHRIPFGFVKVVGAMLEKSDWLYSGREGESRRTITVSTKALPQRSDEDC